MQTIQVVLDQELLQATDLAARESKVNRSALIREALRGYLKRLQIRAAETRDRAGYERIPDTTDDLEAWEREAAWPKGQSEQRLREVCAALQFALGCDDV